VGYQEFFASGEAQGGAYQCRVTLSDPDGWHWRPGGPSAQAFLQNPFGLPPPLPTPPIPPPLPIEMPIPPSSLGLLARLLALLPELGVAAALATLLPTNSPDDPGYQSEWDLIRRYAPPTDKDRAELADLERRHAEGTLTAEEEAHLLALLPRIPALLPVLPGHLPLPTSNLPTLVGLAKHSYRLAFPAWILPTKTFCSSAPHRALG
jgi:hypothetical protein